MANTYKQVSNFGTETHFSQAVTGELAFSRMLSTPQHLTTFNAGDIVPIYCLEVLPHDTFEIDIDAIIRQTTLLTPTMGKMTADFYAFFVPNRVVNHSFKTVMGENPNGSWTASSVSLAPLVGSGPGFPTSYTVPVGSVADYYGFPTQSAIPSVVLQQCHDLKFRGYVEIYNEFFRDQNYQPPIPYSKLNVYQGFFDPSSSSVPLNGVNGSMSIGPDSPSDNSFGEGAVLQSLYGAGSMDPEASETVLYPASGTGRFRATSAPLKANKLHDYFTSVLPSPQKGAQVFIPLTGNAPVLTGSSDNTVFTNNPLRFRNVGGATISAGGAFGAFTNTASNATGYVACSTSQTSSDMNEVINLSNLYADLSQISSVTLSDLRMAAAVQQIYESLAVGGSRYREFVRSFFALEVDDPFKDIPSYLGHIRRDLDLYQTAQTSASETGSTAQGNLAAFGYTATGGKLFKETFLEHGYIHILCVVRHRNIYSSYLAPDNFRQNMLDFYTPQLANISEQPVYTKFINPFNSDPSQVFGYQEAWAEYRYDPDYVSGYMRPGVTESLSIWNYADDFNSSLTIATGDWLKSNSQEVLDRTLATTSSLAPQLKGQFTLRIDKERPMPTYSIPGLDIV